MTIIPDERRKLAHNEQTKLTATALNNVAVAFVIAGFVAPVVGVGQGFRLRWAVQRCSSALFGFASGLSYISLRGLF
jgi:hypothetical protein